MRRFFQSLKSRLILLVVLVALPGLVGLTYHSYIDRQHAINVAQLQAINTVDITTAYQAQLIKKTQSFLQVLSTFTSVLKPESPECSTVLADILKINDNYINLGVPLADGELLCNASPLNKRINVANRPYIQQALATRDFSIGEFQVDRAAGVTSINFAYPVIHPVSDKIVGLAVAVVSLDWWSQHLSESRLPENTVAYITDHDQKIIAAYPANSELLGTHINSVQSNLLESNSNLSQVSKTIKSADNHLRIFVSRPLFNTSDLSDINISVGIPFGEKLSDINTHLMITGGFLLSFVILMLAIAIWGIQKSVLIPLKDLLQFTKNLELGMNVDDRPQHGSSELINLQQRFASMASTRLHVEQQLKNSQSSLQASESRLSSHIENTPLGCISWDRNFVCTEWNKSAENIFGYREDEAIGRYASELIVIPELIDEVNAVFSSLLEQEGGVYNSNENLTKDGRVIICEWYNTCILEKDGSVTGITSLVQNVTEHKQLEEKLIQAASVFSHAREGVIITDAAGIIVDVNDSFVAITGYEHDEVLGKKPSILKSDRQSPEFYAQLWKSLAEKGHWHGEIWNKRKNHEIFPQLLTISSVYDEVGKVKNYVSLFTDITETKNYQLQLEHMAHYDVLTSLPNRSLLADRLNQGIIQSKRSKQPLAVAFLDLDGFKTVNDEYGHKFGDELLIGLGHRIKGALRDGDTLSRFGGDEFVAILTNFDKAQDLEPILERLLKATSEPIAVSGTLVKVSASIGVTLFPLDDADADQLIRHADQAMYIAKQKGKNCYHLFDIESDGAIKNRLESIQHISTAIDNREFVLYYQPKVNMKTGEIIGAEALIRWQHPERGLLPPIDFLPLIESHSFNIQIGEWVIDEALSQISKWQARGLNLPVSVNIAALQLQQKNFADRLATLLAAHTDVAPSALQLEVLETSALGDVMDASEIMNNCVKLGVNFAIDDFGTGYSSLTYLRRLPADLIKIDQTFVRDMLVDPEDLAIVAGVIALATSFNRQVIAEGVETVAHGTALLQLGCELAQGYGIARPMPADQIPEWTTNWQPDAAWQLTQHKISKNSHDKIHL
ncbi:MAG: diguanylate cyclase (GGDEF)-like protein/PAS domain S-box-containing protein [Oleiphilaceae bacterium]|jgi:diguanylate cyclase (GGDEF)-like protein/PAS domain S-box-containing protein